MLSKPTHSRKGFSLVELTVVVVVLGSFAALAVPRSLISAEKARAAEGFACLKQTEMQQDRFHASTGRYAYSKEEIKRTLNEKLEESTYFDISAYSSNDWEKGWSVRLTRNGARSCFGPYTIIWNQDGFDERGSTIKAELHSVQ
jgi:prepilin-type N-terminal cleavage/methylation domain-containing protein